MHDPNLSFTKYSGEKNELPSVFHVNRSHQGTTQNANDFCSEWTIGFCLFSSLKSGLQRCNLFYPCMGGKSSYGHGTPITRDRSCSTLKIS